MTRGRPGRKEDCRSPICFIKFILNTIEGKGTTWNFSLKVPHQFLVTQLSTNLIKADTTRQSVQVQWPIAPVPLNEEGRGSYSHAFLRVKTFTLKNKRFRSSCPNIPAACLGLSSRRGRSCTIFNAVRCPSDWFLLLHIFPKIMAESVQLYPSGSDLTFGDHDLGHSCFDLGSGSQAGTAGSSPWGVGQVPKDWIWWCLPLGGFQSGTCSRGSCGLFRLNM